jgi:hypothetical protein
VTLRGVSVTWLLADFRKQVPAGMTTALVAETIIKPATMEQRCSYAEQLPQLLVGKPAHFVSHWWGADFHATMYALEDWFASNVSDAAFVWMDIMVSTLTSM